MIAFLATALSACAGSAEHGKSDAGLQHKPVRVMSMNQCADQIVLALLPPERIVSVTSLGHNPDGSPHFQALPGAAHSITFAP